MPSGISTEGSGTNSATFTPIRNMPAMHSTKTPTACQGAPARVRLRRIAEASAQTGTAQTTSAASISTRQTARPWAATAAMLETCTPEVSSP